MDRTLFIASVVFLILTILFTALVLMVDIRFIIFMVLTSMMLGFTMAFYCIYGIKKSVASEYMDKQIEKELKNEKDKVQE
jgi:archaellum biogenesis protein FlaJ (TadC family)